MERDVEYIDELVGNKLKNLKETSAIKWTDFSSKYSGKLQPNNSLFPSAKSIVTAKNTAITILSLSIFTAGIVLYNNSNNTNKTIITPYNKSENTKSKKVILKEVNKEEKINLPENDKTSKKILNDSTSVKEKKKEEHIVIKVKVPVHKEVKIKKEVFIDTVSNKNTL